MQDRTDDELAAEASRLYHQGVFDQELVIREELARRLPNNPYVQHNLALALMQNEKYDEALTIFDYLVVEHPTLARAHNNRAVLLIRLGFDWQILIGAFGEALIRSESFDDFMRHLMNACNTIAYGLDDGARPLFQGLEELLPSIVKEFSEPEYYQRNLDFILGIVSAYKSVSDYREAFAQRRWKTANQALLEAVEQFQAVGFNEAAQGLEDHVRPYMSLCRDTVSVVERIGSQKAYGLASASEDFLSLHERARTLVHGADAHERLVDIIGWFLYGALNTWTFLSSPHKAVFPDLLPQQEISQLSALSFRELGREFSAILDYLRKQCLRVQREVEDLADMSLTKLVVEDAWLRIQIFANGLVLDFRGADIALARDMIGWDYDSSESAKSEIRHFRSFIERQASGDVYVNGKPQENIARALLQAYLRARSYREIPVRGGRSDILAFKKDGRFLYETKIWKGKEYHEQGLRELREYILGESDDNGLDRAFYLVFDPTITGRAAEYAGGEWTDTTIANVPVEIVIIRLYLSVPSKAS